ncbi:MAG: hypothetical protein ACRD3Q_19105 [Terriglobales bacterium]
MGTTWNSDQEQNNNRSNTRRLAPPPKEVASIGKDAGLRFTRAQKFAAVACVALVGVLLAVSACSKEEVNSPLAPTAIAAPNSTNATPTELPGTGTIEKTAISSVPPVPAASAPHKKAHRKLAANVTYKDANSGVSFIYPRKARLNTSDSDSSSVRVLGDTQAKSTGIDDLPMNFVAPGGMSVATVALPSTQYAGTDFQAGLFRVNLNRSVSADQCSHFAFVDTSDADGEPIDAENVKVGTIDMKMTSEFAGNALRQTETRYYHNYENGACYEYVLGLGTAGIGQQGVEAVDRDQVFGRLEKILASVKIPAAEEQSAQTADTPKPEAQKQEVQPQEAQTPAAEKPNADKPAAQKEEKKDATEQAVTTPEPGK